MVRLPVVPISELPEELANAVERGVRSRMLSSTLAVQVWAHRPQLALAWLNTIEQMHAHGVLDDRLRELVRLKIASITSCRACQVARKSDRVSEEDIACLSTDDRRFTPAERAAMRYAQTFASDPLDVDDAMFDELKCWFDTPQIVELNMFCALMLAGGRMTFVQRAYEEEKTA
jgi:alkylhydroperoxidase family enzyme